MEELISITCGVVIGSIITIQIFVIKIESKITDIKKILKTKTSN